MIDNKDFNPYSAPTAVVQDINEPNQLAGRGERLGAALIDGLILMFILIPLMWFGGYFKYAMSGQQPSLGLQLIWTLIGFAVFVLLQGYTLHQSGQSIAKKLLGIKIIDRDGKKPPLYKLIALRYGLMQLIALVPIIGVLVVGFVNPLMIFSKEKRCLHDLIAGTYVVKVQ